MADFENITCPYCFKTFSHQSVLFRSSTAFNEVDLDPTGMGRTREDIMIDLNLNDSQKSEILRLYDLREKFLIRDDDKYMDFWEKFGSTSEVNSGINDDILDYQRPLIDPRDSTLVPNGAQLDEDGFVYKIEDCFQHDSYDRVCPKCHNPLPPNYGKFDIKFISVIGIQSAGKTVFLSKLIENISKYAAKLGMAALPASNSSRKFVKDNLVAENRPLPGATPERYMAQPLFYNLTYTQNNKHENKMFVIYDIAGENCINSHKIKNFANFVSNSNGLIVLVDPEQFKCLGGKAEGLAEGVLATLRNVFTGAGMVKIPLALCISKSDIMRPTGMLPEMCFNDVRAVNRSAFCATEYNQISNDLSKIYENDDESSILVALEQNYRNFNYFAFTTLNCDVVKDEKGVKIPERRPDPKRIEEPLFWMFKEFGFIGSDVPIVDHTPVGKKLKEKEKEKAGYMDEITSLGPLNIRRRRNLNELIKSVDQEIIALLQEKNA